MNLSGKNRLPLFLAGLVAVTMFVGVSFAQTLYTERDGYVIMEAENTSSSLGAFWVKKTTPTNYCGTGGLEFTGNDVNGSGSAHAPLTYQFKINTAGTYKIKLRAHKRLQGEPQDKCNDCYIKVTGDYTSGGPGTLAGLTSLGKCYIHGVSDVTWDYSGLLDEPSTGWDHVQASYNFKAGVTYTLTVDGRSIRYNLDRIIFHTPAGEAMALNRETPETTDGSSTGGSTLEILATDFSNKGNFYVDATNSCLAIDPTTSNRNATATTKFTGSAGTYNLTINGVGENDGRSLIKVWVGSTLVGEYRVAATTETFATGTDFNHTFSNVTVAATDSIKVQAFVDSTYINNAWEYCRARWLKVVFSSDSPITPVVDTLSAFTQIEAESYNSMSGVQIDPCTEGGNNVGWTNSGDYIVFNAINFGTGAASFSARVATANAGGNLEIRLDSLTGTLLGTATVATTGGWQVYTTVTANTGAVSGVHKVYLKFTGSGTDYLFNVNWFRFTASGVVSASAFTQKAVQSFAIRSITPTEVNFSLPANGTYAMSVVNVSGSVVFSRSNAVGNAGINKVSLGRHSLPSGLYLTRLSFNGKVALYRASMVR